MSTVHVMPSADLVGHDADDGCPCGVSSRAVELDDGRIGWVVVHNSLDGREASE